MINTSHPGTTPHDTETASYLDSATGQAGTIGDWAASLAKLLRVAYREVDTDRERAKAAIARASSLLRAEIERSSFDPAHNRLHLEQDAEGQIRSDRLEIRCRRKDRREVWAKVSTSAAPNAGRLLLCLLAIDVTRRKQPRRHLAMRKPTSPMSRGWRRWVNSPRRSPMRSTSPSAQSQCRPPPAFGGWSATSLISMRFGRAWSESSVTPGAQGMWFEALQRSPRGRDRNNPRST